jgi:hypothetical protein
MGSGVVLGEEKALSIELPMPFVGVLKKIFNSGTEFCV